MTKIGGKGDQQTAISAVDTPRRHAYNPYRYCKYWICLDIRERGRGIGRKDTALW